MKTFNEIFKNQIIKSVNHDDKMIIVYSWLLKSVFNVMKKHENLRELNIIEIGVYKGGTANLISNIMKEIQKDSDIKINVYLFDTFEGIPYNDKTKDNIHQIGDFSDVNYKEICDFFSQYSFVKIYKGEFKDTCNILNNKLITFCHIDVDVYESYKHCLDYIYKNV